MSDEWMPSLQLKLARQDYDQLPRHPAYKYELIGGVTYISPWPRYYHAQLDLSRFPAAAPDRPRANLRRLQSGDCELFVPIFKGAFGHLQPFGSLSDEDGEHATEQCLTRTFAGNDGPMVDPACFVAMEGEKLAGAILITLLPGGDPTEWDSFRWSEPAPSDLWERCQGQPHLTWIFVRRMGQGSGIGTQLLHEAAGVLRRQGYSTLWTTFMLGNDSSLLWHWRNGFELFPHAMSRRQMRKTFEKFKPQAEGDATP